MKDLSRLLLLFFLVSCIYVRENSITIKKLHFLEEYIVENSLFIEETLIGGLSGIEYTNGNYVLVEIKN